MHRPSSNRDIESSNSGHQDRGTRTRYVAGFGRETIKSDVPFGAAASLLLHGGLILATLFTWQRAMPIMPEDVIAVEVVSDTPSVKGEAQAAETKNIGVDTQNPSPLPQPLPPSMPTNETVTEPTPPPPAMSEEAPPLEQRADVPPPVPQQATPKQAAAAPAPAPAPSPKPKPKPATATAPAARQPPLQAAPKPAPQKATPRPPTTPPAATGKTGRTRDASAAPLEFDLAAASNAASGADSGGRRNPRLASPGQAARAGQAGGGTLLTGDLEAALRAQMKECWAEPADMSNARNLVVEVNIEMGIDGRLTRAPILVSPSSRAGASASLVVAIDNALRAASQCAPYRLPPDRYETWRSVRFVFDPRRMAR